MTEKLTCNINGEIQSDTKVIIKLATQVRYYLYEEPRCNKSQSAVLPVEAVVICIECKMVKVEESATIRNKYKWKAYCIFWYKGRIPV